MRTEAAQRVELVFSLFDANGNGVIDSGDFDLMTGRVLEAGGGGGAAPPPRPRGRGGGGWGARGAPPPAPPP
ncbi:hypothetical protein ACFW1I_00635, partial [Streptomyces sp. NPDC058955]